MYTSFFGLNEKPFSITPDPRYLFMSERHGEALAHLVYGVTESGGFMQLTGEVGTGKTTLVRSLLLNRMRLCHRPVNRCPLRSPLHRERKSLKKDVYPFYWLVVAASLLCWHARPYCIGCRYPGGVQS